MIATLRALPIAWSHRRASTTSTEALDFFKDSFFSATATWWSSTAFTTFCVPRELQVAATLTNPITWFATSWRAATAATAATTTVSTRAMTIHCCVTVTSEFPFVRLRLPASSTASVLRELQITTSSAIPIAGPLFTCRCWTHHPIHHPASASSVAAHSAAHAYTSHCRLRRTAVSAHCISGILDIATRGTKPVTRSASTAASTASHHHRRTEAASTFHHGRTKTTSSVLCWREEDWLEADTPAIPCCSSHTSSTALSNAAPCACILRSSTSSAFRISCEL
mmetsp:Transcript_9403/g.15181  ORF Transcript_9403/g.15181 Transcript_9403/m.15181 type:complete len:281 (-) Transcript_9403:110-952(-)